MPTAFAPAWLFAVPAAFPRIAAELARIAIHHGHAAAAAVLLAQRRDALMQVEPDDLLAPLVGVSAEHPQTVLMPFAGCYGEPTQVAAAAWHLDHGEPAAALELARPIRSLSAVADAARQIAALAAAELDQRTIALEQLTRIADPDIADATALRLDELGLRPLTDPELATIAQRAPVTRPETCFAALRGLLNRRRLDLARSIARDRVGEPWASRPLIDTFTLLLKRPSGGADAGMAGA
jgi:hypothetical protein